ncbi:MAG: transposase family protein [Tannerella forsythia]|uniref:transposase family protein n=1 Tax=Tannerella forsythia TaxID=28112 RepID=UPI00361E5B07
MGRCKHKLSDILVIALVAYLYGGEGLSLCMSFVQSEKLRFVLLVELPNDCPSVDIFERVLQHIEPESLYACLEIMVKI